MHSDISPKLAIWGIGFKLLLKYWAWQSDSEVIYPMI